MSDGHDVTVTGRLFHARAMATGKARTPTSARRVCSQTFTPRNKMKARTATIKYKNFMQTKLKDNITDITQTKQYSLNT